MRSDHRHKIRFQDIVYLNMQRSTIQTWNMQKYSMQVTVPFQNLKFPDTGNQIKEMQKEVQ